MTRKLIVATHGNFASGIMTSVELICGKSEHVLIMDAYTKENYDLSAEVKKVMENQNGDELIVVTDLFGGSINNEFMRYLGKKDFHLISGLNLGLLIELIGAMNQDGSTDEIIRQTISISKAMIQYCNESVEVIIEEEEF